MMSLQVAAAVHLCLGLNTDDLLRDKSSTLQSRVQYVCLYFWFSVWLAAFLMFQSDIHSTRSCFLVVLCLHVTPGDGGGGDGSSGSEESGNDGGVSTIPLPPTVVQTTYDVLRGLGIVGSSAVGEDEDGDLNLPGHGRNSLSRHTEVRMGLTSGTLTNTGV